MGGDGDAAEIGSPPIACSAAEGFHLCDPTHLGTPAAHTYGAGQWHNGADACGGRRRAAGSGPAKKLPAGEPRSGEAGGPSAPPEVSHASRLNNSCEGASREERWGVAAVRSASAPGFARVQFPLELGPLLLGRQVLALLHGDRRAEPLHLWYVDGRRRERGCVAGDGRRWRMRTSSSEGPAEAPRFWSIRESFEVVS